MNRLAFTRCGAGAPLVLLHGLGSDRQAWEPVLPMLAAHFDVLTVDLPGFGDSEPLPASIEPSPSALARSVAGLLDELGIEAAHVAGNSLGGWIALELARVRPISSVALLSPAGLWFDNTPLYDRASLRASRWLASHGAGLLTMLVKYRWGRILILGQTHGRPTRMSAEQARHTITALGACPGFDAALAATVRRRCLAGPVVAAPVALAFGSRDLVLLRRQSRHLDQLPSGTRPQELPGCGHVPMYDDPQAVAAFIVASTRRELPISAGSMADRG